MRPSQHPQRLFGNKTKAPCVQEARGSPAGRQNWLLGASRRGTRHHAARRRRAGSVPGRGGGARRRCLVESRAGRGRRSGVGATPAGREARRGGRGPPKAFRAFHLKGGCRGGRGRGVASRQRPAQRRGPGFAFPATPRPWSGVPSAPGHVRPGTPRAGGGEDRVLSPRRRGAAAERALSTCAPAPARLRLLPPARGRPTGPRPRPPPLRRRGPSAGRPSSSALPVSSALLYPERVRGYCALSSIVMREMCRGGFSCSGRLAGSRKELHDRFYLGS